MRERIVILANSRKLSGKCIAGKNSDGDWVRLTKNNHGPIPVNEARNYTMLTVLEVNGIANRPSNTHNYHTENSTYTGVQVIGTLNKNKLEDLIDKPDDIFGVGRCVAQVEAQKLNQSLLFVKVTDFCIYIKDGGQYKDTLRGEFNYNGEVYTDISITDSATEARFANQHYPCSEDHAEAYLTISLGEIFNGAAYKLISGIIL